jgi:predicted AAA+ superfamily ATPase
VLGGSWEGFVIENLLAAGGDRITGHYYRTSGGAEVDLVLAFDDGRLWAIEIKRGVAPKVDRGFHEACRDLRPARKLVVCPTDEPFSLGDGIEAVPLATLARQLATE